MPAIKIKKFQKISKTKYCFGTGRRKSAIARVRIIKGKGNIIINGQEIESYFELNIARKIILTPLKLTGFDKKIDLSVMIKGGGKIAQAHAIQLGLSRALIKFEPDLKTTLRKSGFLTQDSREKERKKPGLKRARRAPQWQKR